MSPNADFPVAVLNVPTSTNSYYLSFTTWIDTSTWTAGAPYRLQCHFTDGTTTEVGPAFKKRNFITSSPTTMIPATWTAAIKDFDQGQLVAACGVQDVAGNPVATFFRNNDFTAIMVGDVVDETTP